MKSFKSLRSMCFLTGVAVTAMTLSGGAALAQAADDEESAGLTEIIVTARKVQEDMQTVPVAITALSGDDLADRSIIRVQDIGRFVPGMTTRPGSNTPSALTITLRGQIQTDVLITLDPSVGTYVDGVYWARAYGLNADLLDIQSVQVLKGPQGTLFGRNTTGGALLITSNNPELDEFGGRFSLTAGRFNEFQAMGVVNAPLVTDKVGLRIAAQRFTRDGYVTNVVGPTAVSAVAANNPAVARKPFVGAPNGVEMDNRDRWNARAKLDVKPTENLTLRFSTEFFEMDEISPSRQIRQATTPFTASNSTYNLGGTGALFTGIVNGGPPPTSAANAAASTSLGLGLLNAIIADLADKPDKASINEVPYAYAKTQTYGFTAIQDTSFGQIQLITGHRKIEAFAGLDLDGSPFPIHFTESQQEVEQTSGELQVTGNAFADKLTFAAGAFAFSENGFDQSISIVAPAINPVTSHFWASIDNKSYGVYAQGSWALTDRLSVSGGLRYSSDEKGIESRNNNFNRTTSAHTCSLFTAPAIVQPEVVGVAQCAVRRSDTFTGWSYLAGLEYRPTDDVLLYAKTSKGFRSGGQNLRAPSAAFLIPFQPEEAYAYEAGAKTEFLDRRVRLNLAAYQTDVENIQRSTLIAQPGSAAGASATVLGNAGKARFRGLEGEFQALLTEGLTLSASAAIVNPEYVDYRDLSGDRSFELFDGVAEEQFTLAADYRTYFGATLMKAHVDYSWIGDNYSGSYNFPQNASPAPPGSTAVPGAVNAQNAVIQANILRPAGGILNARLSFSFKDDAYEVSLFGRNLGDNRDYNSPLLVAPVGYVQSSRIEPMTYGVSATVTF
jgi:iron complex outermembrane receptor protein